MKTDLTFFTNEPGSTLLDRFKKTLKDVNHFDILVGFFLTSGFFDLYQALRNVDFGLKRRRGFKNEQRRGR